MKSKTLSQKMEDLKEQGYTHNFSIKDEAIIDESKKSVEIDSLQIEDVYRFEGMTNPSDNSILYAVKTSSGIKGVLVDGYGVSSEISKALAKRLNR
ncbi:MAG: phosphoribosylpyrophosphate synthetase [Bacteroidota bacterium]